MKELAIFDIDGVVYDGTSIFDLIQDQEKSGFIESGLWSEYLELLKLYKGGELSYKETADKMLVSYSVYLEGKTYKEVLDNNIDFISRNRGKIMPYFEDVYKKLKDKFDLYFVTTNYDFTAEAFTRAFGFDGFFSSTINKDGDLIKPGLKHSLGGNKGSIADFVSKYDKSFAVGNSENDISMLELVNLPIAFEPDEKLRKHATEKGWPIATRDTITDIIITHEKIG